MHTHAHTHTQQGEGCVSGDGGDRVNLVKSLLTRWREKVFVLLLQQKLQQMEDSKMAKENEREVMNCVHVEVIH